MAAAAASDGAVLKIAVKQQKYGNSCWACCARLVVNYYMKQDIYASDDDFASTVKKDPSQVQDIEAILKSANLFSYKDGSPFPTFVEIQKEIRAGKPVIACITTNQAQVAAGNIQAGHYVIVSGYSVKGAKGFIYVIDPASGKEGLIYYDDKLYYDIASAGKVACYWGVTYYTKNPS